ncbi:E3 ubiquitin-protein ligase TRIM56-like [Haliotis rufescens]|uniref:E3 ubiquitin-protein ligase TRIM56-like n=1 Tax=Haliotis rufescens TaxID=6454 RepID=UPI00201F8634|nr:E3 ubiquitin-protein ligase TRIM56-like [Haliotis rufescens]
MSATIQLDDDFFVCSICNDNFSDPRSLPCLHSFCHQCLRQHINYSATLSPPSFLCPVCRGVTLVPAEGAPPSSWADFFPGNFLMKELMGKRVAGTPGTSPGDTAGGSPAGAREYWCVDHPDCPLNMFCVSCKASSCRKCMFSKHIHCSVTVKLIPQGKSTTEDMGIFVERLKREITSVRDQEICIQDELAYLAGQAEKARTGIHKHITKFYSMLENAKKKLLSKIDTEYDHLTRSLENQHIAAKEHLEQLRNSMSAATAIRNQDSDTTEQLKRKIQKTLTSVSSAESLQYERMRISFTPDFSWLDKDFSLGSVAFYNSRVPASDGVSADMPRSLSSDCVPPCREEAVSLRHHTNTMLRSTSVPWFNESWSKRELGIVNEHPMNPVTPYLGRDSDESNIPVLATGGGSSALPLVDTSLFRHSAPVIYPGGERDPELVQPTPSPQVPDNESSSKQPTRNSYSGYELVVDLNTDSDECASTQKKLISFNVMRTYQLSTSDDESLPVVKSIVALSEELFMVTDAANKSVKIFNQDGLCSSISFQSQPYGLAVASQDRALVSFPENKKIVVISVGKELKIISTIQSTKSYTRLMHYRPGMTAALCADSASLDVLSLQGKVMKTFRVFDRLREDIPFSVDIKQGFVIWDSTNSSLIWKSKTGSTTCQATSEYVKNRIVSGLACDLLGNVYIVQDGGVVKVTSKGDYSGDVDHVFSCQSICFSPRGHLYVAEIGGHCKVHSL